VRDIDWAQIDKKCRNDTQKAPQRCSISHRLRLRSY
jgi:hypothetical protein